MSPNDGLRVRDEVKAELVECESEKEKQIPPSDEKTSVSEQRPSPEDEKQPEE